MSSQPDHQSDLRIAIAEVERAIDSGAYRPGPWARILTRARAASASERRDLSADVSRVSRKLHLRRGRKTIKAQTGFAIEAAAVALGDILLAVGIHHASSVAAVAGTVIWIIAFQPLVKVMTGAALGIGYDYAYLANVEPRFKMEYGSYLAQPRWARVALHLSGAVGSPLGAWLAAIAVRGALPEIYSIAIIAFWTINALNLALLVAGLAGIKQLGVSRTVDTSCGAAGAEIREALGW